MKRAHIRAHDNWSYDLKGLSTGLPTTINPIQINQNKNPILYTIARSWSLLAGSYYKLNENMKKSHVLYNPLLTLDLRDPNPLSLKTFRQIPPIPPELLCNLRFNMITTNNTLNSREVIHNVNNIYLTPLSYMRLTTSVRNYVMKKKIIGTNDGTSVKLENYICKFKKGSKPLRSVLAEERVEKIRPKTMVLINAIYRNSNLLPENITYDQQGKILGYWNTSYLPSRIKDFLLKFTFGKLAINTRLSHMAPENTIDRACTFCKVARRLPAPEETFGHLFWDCNTTSEMYEKFYSQVAPELVQLTDAEQKKFWILGTAPIFLPEIYFTARAVLLYCLWDFHNKKKTFAWYTLKLNFTYELKKIAENGTQTKFGTNNNNFNICRLLNGEWAQ